MAHEPFDYPLGIRPWPNPFPRRRPQLKEGYTFTPLENSSDAYRIVAMVGAAKIPSLIRSFAALIPEEAFFVLEFYDDIEEPPSAPRDEESERDPAVYYSPYLPTAEIMDLLEAHLPRLVHDGFVGFGLANNRAGIEMFYSEEKVLTFFTDNHLKVMNLLAQHGIEHRERLLLPTDFGHDHLSLLCHPRRALPEPFFSMKESELDYACFCRDIVDQLEMYPVEETLSFFLSRREQEEIDACLARREEFAEFLDEDFGLLLFDWQDFVHECARGFEGDLWEYRQCLGLRDMIQFVIEGVGPELGGKLTGIVAEADNQFRELLKDRRKRLDPPSDLPLGSERFWCHGMVDKQGVFLRRDLIREGWFKP